MKKVIIDCRDFKAPEVRANEGILHRMYLKDYEELVEEEAKVAKKLVEISIKKELPKMVALLPDIYSEFQPEEIQQRISETLNVINKVAHLMLDGFHLKVIEDILEISTGHGTGFGIDFQLRFEPLFHDKDCREDFYGTRWQLPCYITEELLKDLMSGVNIDAPTAEDLKRSKVIQVAQTFQCLQEKIDAFIASYEA